MRGPLGLPGDAVPQADWQRSAVWQRVVAADLFEQGLAVGFQLQLPDIHSDAADDIDAVRAPSPQRVGHDQVPQDQPSRTLAARACELLILSQRNTRPC